VKLMMTMTPIVDDSRTRLHAVKPDRWSPAMPLGQQVSSSILYSVLSGLCEIKSCSTPTQSYMDLFTLTVFFYCPAQPMLPSLLHSVSHGK